MSTGERFRGFKAFSKTLLIIVVFVSVASYVLTLIMGFGLFFFTRDGLSFSRQFQEFPVFLFLLAGFNVPGPAGLVFLLIWIIYVICFTTAWKWRENFHTVVGKFFSRPMRSVFNNFLSSMSLISGMTLTAALAIVYSQEAVGVPTGLPPLPPDPYETFLTLAYRPVAEELGFRLIPIGFFMILNLFLIGKNMTESSTGTTRLKLFLTALIYPEGAKKMAGLKTVSEHGVWKGISPVEWVMIVTTSALFGLAHVLGIGWKIGKITSVFVQGFVFALTYLAYGFEAPILLHWFFNYYSFFLEPDLSNKFFPNTIDMLSTIYLVILILGILGWIAFAIEGLRRLL